MKMINLFKKPKAKGPIEYTDKIMEAVCDRRIKGLKINCNGGFDWVDTRYHYLRLLLLRGQVAEIRTGQDLLASAPYLTAIQEGDSHFSSSKSLVVVFESRCTGVSPSGLPTSPKGCAYASPKRIENAKSKFNNFFSKGGAK